MQEMGIHAVYPRPNLSKRNFKEAIVPYLLRNKVISFSNQAWSIDITYIKMQHGHMYLTAIIDWLSRKITAPVILNSDQGCHYTSYAFIQMLKDAEFVQSMSRRGNCWDNAPQESFFGHMKDEV